MVFFRFLERVVVPLVLVAIIVWQHTASTPSGTSAANPSPVCDQGPCAKRGLTVLPASRLRQPLVLSSAGIQEMPPPPGAKPRISARRALP